MTDMTIDDLQNILDKGGSKLSEPNTDLTTHVDEVVEKIVENVDEVVEKIVEDVDEVDEIVDEVVDEVVDEGTNDKETETDKSDKGLDESLVPLKVELYDKLLRRILNACTIKKNGLDMYYERLSISNSFIQTSVIVLSALSTFIQSLSENNIISDYVPITTLCITSYSGLILALAKYLKFEESKVFKLL